MTNTLCDVVQAVTGTVDTLTGGTTSKVTEGLDRTTDEVLGRVGEVLPTGRAKSAPRRGGRAARHHAQADPGARARRGMPVRAVVHRPEHRRPAHPRPSASPSATRTEQPSEGLISATATSLPQPVPARPRTTRPERQESGVHRAAPKKKTAHAEEPRVDLLWPNPFQHELAVPMQDQRVVRPSPPASDVIGTVLTIALLGSAVLATRIVQQRRHGNEPAESIPFEPARAGNGRHRLA
ncbi:hypothetical protein [Nonomuraea salmonea]|uniref:hypothetical protein n=1 Tax=Nonomuraea salmonea TaxID=46181 RepID=UPI002FED7526